jgi:hypothetical protein
MKKNENVQHGEKIKNDEAALYNKLLTEGKVVSKKKMSTYMKKCYNNRTYVKCRIHCNLDYEYYIDGRNNTCTLFFGNFLNHRMVLMNLDLVLVVKYGSQEHFMVNSLAEYYQNHCVDDDDEFSWEDNYFRTNSRKYNNTAIVMAVSNIMTQKQINWKVNKKTVAANIIAKINKR